MDCLITAGSSPCRHLLETVRYVAVAPGCAPAPPWHSTSCEGCAENCGGQATLMHRGTHRGLLNMAKIVTMASIAAPRRLIRVFRVSFMHRQPASCFKDVLTMPQA